MGARLSEQDRERAIQCAWDDLADACCEHDCEHEARALAELRRLGQLPDQREPSCRR